MLHVEFDGRYKDPLKHAMAVLICNALRFASFINWL